MLLDFAGKVLRKSGNVVLDDGLGLGYRCISFQGFFLSSSSADYLDSKIVVPFLTMNLQKYLSIPLDSKLFM